jgi:membrane fusion protein (multidrug efflux system)
MSEATADHLAAPRMPAGAVPGIRTRSLPTLRAALMLGGIAGVGIVAVLSWISGGRILSVDNAYVRAGKLVVATDVAGIVQSVEVRDGQRVHRGDVLFRLDPQQFDIALDRARANLVQVTLQMQAARHEYRRLLRDIDVRQAQLQGDEANHNRAADLVRSGNVSHATYDEARFRLAGSRAAVESLKVQAEMQLARLGGDPEIDVRRTPEFGRALADVNEAQRQHDHTVVRAPFDAVATQVESISPGMALAAGTAALGLVAVDAVWIAANPKETELAHVKPGDAASIRLDAYPGRTWHGVVESIAPSSGAEFAILAAQTVSGNWVRIVQRIPLRIAITRRADDPELRAGMSAVVDIDTGHVRRLTDLLPWPLRP